MLFIHFSAEKTLQLSVHLCWCDFRFAEERPKCIALLVLAFRTLDVSSQSGQLQHGKNKKKEKKKKKNEL